MFKSGGYSDIYSITSNTYNVTLHFESNWILLGEYGVDDYIQQANQIMSETDLYCMDGDDFCAYKIDGQYVSEEGYEAAMARFVDPDEAYKLNPVTYENPIP